MRQSWIIWVSLKSNYKCLYKRHTEKEKTDRRQCEHGCRLESARHMKENVM